MLYWRGNKSQIKVHFHIGRSVRLAKVGQGFCEPITILPTEVKADFLPT